jgi:predicted kinase
VERLKKILESNEPWLVLLVGTPLAGKSTLLKEHFGDVDYTLMSRDEILMEVAGTRDYNKAWNILSAKKDGQKPVDKKLKYRLLELAKAKENVVIDMTNLTKKGRNRHLAKFPKHFKAAVVFEFLSDEEYMERNEKRDREEGKALTMATVHRMKASYQEITDDEDFDLVVKVKDLNV